jgi:hypothetical protein
MTMCHLRTQDHLFTVNDLALFVILDQPSNISFPNRNAEYDG